MRRAALLLAALAGQAGAQELSIVPPNRPGTLATTPGMRLSFFSIRAAHEAQVIPPIRRSTVCAGSRSADKAACSAAWAGVCAVVTDLPPR